MPRVAWAKYLAAFATLLLCSLLWSCGGSSPPKPLVVTITPSSAALTINASVHITFGTDPELPPYSRAITWAIQEYQSSTRCTEERLDSNVSHPIADCPYGWLEITSPVGERQVPTEAYYYSPNTAGVWTVSVHAEITDGVSKVEYQGSGSAVVTVTAP